MNLIGQKIGPYEILEEIGRGGMGLVFKARHEKLGRLVALKMLAPHLAANPKMRARFLREAKLQANLLHPNVVNIFDYLEQNGNAFLVMEYVKGKNLEEMLLKKGRFTVPEVLYVAEGVLEALSFMHRQGVIHRDIKPSNILVTETGLIKVTDFGIARLVEEEASLTQVGGKVGTLFYMAPELLKGGKLSPAADIYSLGVTLFQLLTGQVPFTGKTEYEIIKAHLEKPPPDVKKLNPEVPEALAEVIKKALAKDPTRRFPSAAAFLEAIKALKTGITGEKTPFQPKPFRFSFSQPNLAKITQYWWAGLIALAVLILVLSLLWWYKSHQTKRAFFPASLSHGVGGGGRSAGSPPLPLILNAPGTPQLQPSPLPLPNGEKETPKRRSPKSPEETKKKIAKGKPKLERKPSEKKRQTPTKKESGWIIRK